MERAGRRANFPRQREKATHCCQIRAKACTQCTIVPTQVTTRHESQPLSKSRIGEMPVFSPSRNAAIHSLCCRVRAENWLDAQLWIWIHSDPDTFIKQNPDLATILQFIKLLLSLVEGYVPRIWLPVFFSKSLQIYTYFGRKKGVTWIQITETRSGKKNWIPTKIVRLRIRQYHYIDK